MTASSILVTGGAGYIGAVLTPKLIAKGYRVSVLDCFFFGEQPLVPVGGGPVPRLIRGDIRDAALVDRVLGEGHFDTVIHLAAISNDPSSELDPDITRGVNLDGCRVVMEAAKRHGVRRFLYASSASVYGIKETEHVTEDLSLEPLTIYARFKAEGEAILNRLADDRFCVVSVRAATVCGYSPRLRLDLTINILTSHALTKGKIRVFGGAQMRPNIHIEDLADFYVLLCEADPALIQRQVFNVSHTNASVLSLAEMIRAEIDPALPIDIIPSDDNRSYHLSADRAKAVLGFVPVHALNEAVHDLKKAFAAGRVERPEDSIYRNVVHMKQRLDFWKRTD